MRRTIVGVLALLLILVSLVGFAQYGLAKSEATFFLSMCWRMGLVLGAFWLALPKLLDRNTRGSLLVLSVLAVFGLILVIRPRAILFLWPVLVIIAVMQLFQWLVKPPEKKSRKHKS